MTPVYYRKIIARVKAHGAPQDFAQPLYHNHGADDNREPTPAIEVPMLLMWALPLIGIMKGILIFRP